MSHPLNPLEIPAGAKDLLQRPGVDPYALRLGAGQAAGFDRARGGVTVIRPGAILGSAPQYVKFSGMAEIDADNPATIRSTGGGNTSFASRSIVEGGAGSKKKILIKLNNPVAIWSAVAEAPILLLSKNTSSSYVTVDVDHNGALPSKSIQYWVKVTPIVADFNIDTQTWNNYGSLSLAGDASTIVLADTRINTGVVVTNAVYTLYPFSLQGGGLAFQLSHSGSFGAAGTLIYGFVVEVLPDFVNQTLLNSIEGLLTAQADHASLALYGSNALILADF